MLEIILVQGFCPLKIKITQFPNGFLFKLLFCYPKRTDFLSYSRPSPSMLLKLSNVTTSLVKIINVMR